MVFAMLLILALTMIMQSTKRHLTKKLENLDWKLDEQKEISKLITNDVGDIVSGSYLDTRGLVINMYWRPVHAS